MWAFYFIINWLYLYFQMKYGADPTIAVGGLIIIVGTQLTNEIRNLGKRV